MTLGSGIVRCGCDTSASEESYSSLQSSISSCPPTLKFHENTSVIKIGSVNVRFAQNFGSSGDDYRTVPLREDAAKHKDDDDEEHYCCGVPWYPSRCMPLAVYANNRCSISLNRNSLTGEESGRLSHRRRIFTTPLVRHCTCTSTQAVASSSSVSASTAGPGPLVNCFGKRENRRSAEHSYTSLASEKCAFCISREKFVSAGSPTTSSTIVWRNCAIYGGRECDPNDNLVSCREIQSTKDTLDRFQKFRFGGDRTSRSNAGRRGSGGSHKKKTQRTSDKSVNLKKLTDKLKQTSTADQQDTPTDAGGGLPLANSSQHTGQLAPPNPNQFLIPLKPEQPDYEDKDDIFDGELKLSKPESRTIVGSYYQRSIPFRSASFSQVFYSPEDRKYVRNIVRKPGSGKRNVSGSENNSATLPRTSGSSNSQRSDTESLQQQPIDDKSHQQQPIQDETHQQQSIQDESQQQQMKHEESHQLQPIQDEGHIQLQPNTIPSDLTSPELPIDPNRQDEEAAGSTVISDTDSQHPVADQPVSLIELQPNEPLTSSVVPIISSNLVNAFPQPPKRTRSNKYKHRHRPTGRLYFSDENIFTSNIEDGGEQTQHPASAPTPLECETISVTITTPQNSDTEADRGDSPSPVVEVNFIPNPPEQPADGVQTDTVNISHGTDGIFDEAEETAGEEIKNHTSVISTNEVEEKLKVDVSHSSDPDTSQHNQTNPSSPEDSLKLHWPAACRDRRLTPQTSTEREEEPSECCQQPVRKQHHLFTRADSYSEAESDHGGDNRSISPCMKDGRLSPSPYGYHDFSDSDSRKGLHSPLPYTKRPLRGPYLEMIVNEQKKPENAKIDFKNLQLFESRFPPNHTVVQDRAVDNYYFRRSNTSPHANKLDVAPSLPKRKISANIPFTSPTDTCSRTTLEAPDQSLIHHQRTISSPSQLEYYPDQMTANQHGTGPSQQLLHQLLRGSSEHSLVQDVDLLKNMYLKPTYKDTRSHIVVELYDTERSYVESLQILVTKYLQPLKTPECSNLIEPYVVEEIFYKIPEILAYHELFLEELRIRLEGWNKSKCIGDIFLETFTKPSVIDAYIAFVNNWKTAKESIKQTCHTKPAFARFLETMAREHKGKLALDSLLIMPVQRIPRYELLIQSLLKHTEICHPDYDKLQEALRQVHDLAMRINCTERDSLELEQIENLIDGLGNLVTGDRGFLRYDMVTMTSNQGLSRKERALFLFNDLLIITSVKRRSSTVKKPSLSSPSTITSTLEANKYKLLMKIPLEHLDIVKVKDEKLRRMMKEMEYLTEDVNTLSQMVDLVTTLHCPHSHVEENIREMLGALNKQLTERHVSESQLSYLELAINTRNSVENISVIFHKAEKRTNWEETFLEAKARLYVSGDRRLNPEFLTSVPIRKTRAGLQFTCAAASCSQQDVWVCNSDGYVGQVCILSLSPEPAVTSCNGVCNARILSVTSVPVSRYIEKCHETPDTLMSSISSSCANVCKSEPYDENNESIPIENLERDIPDIHLDSSSSSDEDDDDECADDQKDSENAVPETVESTMWLGTEDGVVHIYNCADSLRIKRNRLKIQHNYAVYCILYVEKSVFVSLANGEIYVYHWCPNLGWNTTDPTVISVGCVTTPVSRMFLVCGKLWCICHNMIKILNVHTHRIDNSFSILGENNRAITSVAVSGFSVYLSLQNSAVLRVVHGSTCEILSEINIAPAVTKMLSGTDDIIRQHKAACLRVTSLMACKELLWIGTSAGVILTMPMPSVKQNTTKITSSVPHPTGLSHGHTGHVRFLTAVKCQYKAKPETGRRSSKTSDKKPDPNINKMLIISGGDGYEDFRSSSVSEIAGREDSTNHLLIWRS